MGTTITGANGGGDVPAKAKKSATEDRVAKIYQEYLDDPERKSPAIRYAQSKLDGIARVVYQGDHKSEERARLTELMAFRMAQEAVRIAGPDATDLEILLATRIVATELLANTHEKAYYGPGSYMPRTIEIMDRRIDALNRRVQQGAIALARVRRLRTAPGPTVNMAALVMNGKSQELPKAAGVRAVIDVPAPKLVAVEKAVEANH